MLTLRLLKYTPAVVMGLLATLWLINVFWRIWIFPPQYAASDARMISLSHGGVTYFHIPGSNDFRKDSWGRIEVKRREGNVYFGMLSFNSGDPTRAKFAVPHLMLITLLLPLAIGPFISFRFRLWHYLGYTALIAVELTYYFRWQE
jgi:hypothetical protein